MGIIIPFLTNDSFGRYLEKEVAKICVAALESPYACDKTFEVKSVLTLSKQYTVDPDNPTLEKDYNSYFRSFKEGIKGKIQVKVMEEEKNKMVKICCIGVGYVGGPTMDVIALKYPDIEVAIILISSENIEEVMTEIQTNTTMEEFVTNVKANYYSGITSIMVNGKRVYELKGKILDDLRDNTFSGTNGEDVIKNNGKEGVADKEFFDANNDDEQETAKIFRMETNLFEYETPLCAEFKEFNFLLKVNPELFTHDIKRTKTYKDYENELNNELEEP
ncbi:putative reverse transcriptase domain-containing protein [Tanacetum coccineum]